MAKATAPDSTDPTIKIQLRAGCGRTGAIGNEGDVIDVEATLAQTLVSQGAAVVYTEPKEGN